MSGPSHRVIYKIYTHTFGGTPNLEDDDRSYIIYIILYIAIGYIITCGLLAEDSEMTFSPCMCSWSAPCPIAVIDFLIWRMTS